MKHVFNVHRYSLILSVLMGLFSLLVVCSCNPSKVTHEKPEKYRQLRTEKPADLCLLRKPQHISQIV
jgi:hypothetical protein